MLQVFMKAKKHAVNNKTPLLLGVSIERRKLPEEKRLSESWKEGSSNAEVFQQTFFIHRKSKFPGFF